MDEEAFCVAPTGLEMMVTRLPSAMHWAGMERTVGAGIRVELWLFRNTASRRTETPDRRSIPVSGMWSFVSPLEGSRRGRDPPVRCTGLVGGAPLVLGSESAPVEEGAGEGGGAVGEAGEAEGAPAGMGGGGPLDGVAEEVGGADAEQGGDDEGVGVDGDEETGGRVLEERGGEEGCGGHQAEEAEGADGEEVADGDGDEDEGDGGEEAEGGFGVVEFAEFHGEGAEGAEAVRGDEEPEPGEADAEEDLADGLVAGEFFEEFLGGLGLGEEEGVDGDQGSREDEAGFEQREAFVGVDRVHAGGLVRAAPGARQGEKEGASGEGGETTGACQGG